MSSATLIHFRPEQKKGLARRARLRKKSVSQEVRDAVDLWLELPVDSEEQLAKLAGEARRATERMIRDLDETMAQVRRTRKRWEAKP